MIAFPVGVLERRGMPQDLAALRHLVEDRRVRAIVVGLPLHLDGRAGAEADAARKFAAALGEACGLPVALVDERWTTALAERELRDSPRRRRHKKQDVDAVAATMILRTYLEQPPEARS
jgi:putative Holliday junction resolvase